MAQFKKKLSKCTRCTCYGTIFLLLNLFALAAIVNFILVVYLFDNSLGNTPIHQKDVKGYLDASFYKIEKLTKCTVVAPKVECERVTGESQACRAKLQYTTSDGPFTANTFTRFLDSTKYAKYDSNGEYECYYDPYYPERVDYRIVVNARPDLLGWALSLSGIALAILFVQFIIVVIVGIIYMRGVSAKTKSITNSEELDKLMNGLDNDDIIDNNSQLTDV
jgi:hypothetical protein